MLLIEEKCIVSLLTALKHYALKETKSSIAKEEFSVVNQILSMLFRQKNCRKDICKIKTAVQLPQPHLVAYVFFICRVDTDGFHTTCRDHSSRTHDSLFL